ncbi:nucleotidyltransferase family protein [Aestuariibacter sp. AA17]|uniref:Nucleotidyltransferase family protein n=1 Tax=Fluctibacter corallii TaxID=2984329 RepID=A0ABT3A4P6_9ALTE|nr:nucleotidyltransferase family protein [Aestuariibacter sp. AA17]MCV2883562.1 nucleotidyltransferase family protein [Aestuariibacter sp. AA17]
MRAMILAAGRGERMRPLTDSTPKPLLKVKGIPIIEHQIKKLVSAGISDIVINLAWLGQHISDYLGDGSRFRCRIHYSDEGSALETAGGIIKALPLLCPDDYSDQFLVVNGDIFHDVDLSDVIETSQQLNVNNDAHIVLVDNPIHHPKGDFAFTSPFVSLKSENSASYTFAGIAIYHKRCFDSLAVDKLPLGPMLRHMAERGVLTGHLHNGFWCDVGTPERLAWLNELEW